MQYILNVMGFYTDSAVVDVDVGPQTWDSFSQYIKKNGNKTYGTGGNMGLRIKWKYDNSSYTSGSIAYIYCTGDTLSDQYRLYAN
ncbi:hypothetical protein [Peribacillus simplex]|uniref:hypothetical protein n=1 Tax=Peribacillus simplex TaxID=1478 RepID=UPI00333A5408